MQPSGVITFSTDFGHKGPFAGVMKGVVLQRFPQATVVDLGHDIPAHWPPEAGFWISRAYRYFPSGTIHVGIVDPGVGTERRILLAQHDQHLFLAPDNGLLDPILSVADRDRIRCVDIQGLAAFDIAEPSPTFHGRDVFAPVAAEISAGRLRAEQVGPVVSEWIPGWIDEPESDARGVSGVVITIDTFGNLITNIGEERITHIENPRVCMSGHEFAMQTTYGRVQPGDYLALINSFGVVEIARAEGSAAVGLGASRGAPVAVRPADF